MSFSTPPQRSDFIIVGGGTAGCLLAGELARRTDAQILLLEAGPKAHEHSALRRPAEYLDLQGGRYDWNWHCARSPELSGRQLGCPRGRLLGGCSGINATIFCPGVADDLQDWQSQAGSDWSPQAIQAYFRDLLYDTQGRLSIESPRYLSDACEAFIASAQSGIERGQFSGQAMVYQRTTENGQRQMASDAFLGEPLPPNLNILTQASARSIVMQGNRAVGVIVAGRDGDPLRVDAQGAVVVCAGAIASPQLLMLSGIGPADHLTQLGIKPTIDNPLVGRNLTDHLAFPVIYALPDNARFPSAWSVSDLARWNYLRSGPTASNLAEVGGFFDLATLGPDAHRAIQFHVTPTHYLLHPRPHAPAAMSIAVTQCKPASRGHVTLGSSRPEDAPVIDPRYASDANGADIATIVQGVKLARQIASEPPLSHRVGPELLPGPRRVSDDQIARSIARYAMTLYHPVGTCAMSTDPSQGVVDPQFKVHHSEHLYVVDASVFPSIPKANPAATTMMVAHRAASLLAEI